MAPSVACLTGLLTISCVVGVGLSLYAYIIDFQMKKDPNYKPFCDINQMVACSKPFRSKYGRGFGLVDKDSILYKPNSLFGFYYYTLLTLLAQVNNKAGIFVAYVAIILSNVASVYFAYILYYKLSVFCIVCVSTYIVNFVDLILIHLKKRALAEERLLKSKLAKKTK